MKNWYHLYVQWWSECEFKSLESQCGKCINSKAFRNFWLCIRSPLFLVCLNYVCVCDPLYICTANSLSLPFNFIHWHIWAPKIRRNKNVVWIFCLETVRIELHSIKFIFINFLIRSSAAVYQIIKSSIRHHKPKINHFYIVFYIIMSIV